MKQIFITPEIKRMAKQYSKGLFKDKGKTFVQPIVGLKNLIIDLEEVNDELANKDRYINYLKEIIKDYSKIKNSFLLNLTIIKLSMTRLLRIVLYPQR